MRRDTKFSIDMIDLFGDEEVYDEEYEQKNQKCLKKTHSDIDIISIRRPAIKNPVTTSSIHIVYKMTTMQDRKSKLTQAIDKIITQNIEEADCNIHATKAINKLLIQEVGKDWKTYIEKQDRFKRSVILLL
ncbi:24_t:CDS:2 [Entrophospora sp. SA101]|nr:24_t:CDS:2 [Entrophospora sp. SA101]